MILKYDIAFHPRIFQSKDINGFGLFVGLQNWQRRMTTLKEAYLKVGPSEASLLQPTDIVQKDTTEHNTPEKVACKIAITDETSDKLNFPFSDFKVHGRRNFGGSRQQLSSCAVCDVERDWNVGLLPKDLIIIGLVFPLECPHP